MVALALYELAEATLGLAPEMYWSTDEDISRRESKRLFDRLAAGETSPEAVGTVLMANVSLKMQNNMQVLETRYRRLVDVYADQEHGTLSAFAAFDEFFIGLMSKDVEYAIDLGLTARSWLPILRACAEGKLSARDCQDAILDRVASKQETVFSALQYMVRQLHMEIESLKEHDGEPDESKT